MLASDRRTGINMLVPRVQHPQDQFLIHHGPAIHPISFSNIVMDTRIAMYLWHGADAGRPGGIRDVRLTRRACYIGGAPHLPVESITPSVMTPPLPPPA